VDEHIAKPYDPLVLAQPVGDLRIITPQSPDRLTVDLQIPLDALA
jgi:hypothetical protein